MLLTIFSILDAAQGIDKRLGDSFTEVFIAFARAQIFKRQNSKRMTGFGSRRRLLFGDEFPDGPDYGYEDDKPRCGERDPFSTEK